MKATEVDLSLEFDLQDAKDGGRKRLVDLNTKKDQLGFIDQSIIRVL